MSKDLSTQKTSSLMATSPRVNRQYKDSVFTHFFSEDSTRLIELYNAVSGADYPLETPIEINSLTGVLYMDRINDISFVLDDRLVVLVEHQSTINENMPLRMLAYIARIYEVLTKEMALYGKARLVIPHPEFVTIYDGAADYPVETTLLLSDAFIQGVNRPISLELAVKVVNINHGKAESVLAKSDNLSQFSMFVKIVRYHQSIADPKDSAEEVFRRAINECIARGIMVSYLKTHATEVNNMLVTEWDQAIADRVRFAEGKAEGKAEGRAEGKAEGKAEGEAKAKAELVANMASHNLSAQQIADLAGLSVDEVDHILSRR